MQALKSILMKWMKAKVQAETKQQLPENQCAYK